MKKKPSSDDKVTEIVGADMGKDAQFRTWPLTKLVENDEHSGGIQGSAAELGHDVFLAHGYHLMLKELSETDPRTANRLMRLLAETMGKLFRGEIHSDDEAPYDIEVVKISGNKDKDELF